MSSEEFPSITAIVDNPGKSVMTTSMVDMSRDTRGRFNGISLYSALRDQSELSTWAGLSIDS